MNNFIFLPLITTSIANEKDSPYICLIQTLLRYLCYMFYVT